MLQHYDDDMLHLELSTSCVLSMGLAKHNKMLHFRTRVVPVLRLYNEVKTYSFGPKRQCDCQDNKCRLNWPCIDVLTTG